MVGSREPAVDLPDQVQEQRERRREEGLEEGFCVEVARRGSNGVERDVELSDYAEDVDDEADV